MQLELRVLVDGYEKKTYTAETFDLSVGVIDDICTAIDIDTIDITKHADLGARIVKARKQVYAILHDIFGATEEEIRTVKVSNIVEIVKTVYKYMSEVLGMLPKGDEKN